MVKTDDFGIVVPFPDPPPLPKYDPKEEPSKWSHRRLILGTAVEKPVPWTKIGDVPERDDMPDWRGVVRKNVIPLDEAKQYPYGQPINRRYFWFDTPDYADPFKKLWWSTRFFVLTGGILHSLRGILEDRSMTLENNFHIAKRLTIPYIVGGMIASVTAITVANMRGEKDDMWNYGIAGLMAGLYLGRKEHTAILKYSVPCVAAGLVFKYNAEVNGNLLPRFNIRNMKSTLSGNSADNGFATGDFRMGMHHISRYGDPGRDVRRFAN